MTWLQFFTAAVNVLITVALLFGVGASIFGPLLYLWAQQDEHPRYRDSWVKRVLVLLLWPVFIATTLWVWQGWVPISSDWWPR